MLVASGIFITPKLIEKKMVKIRRLNDNIKARWMVSLFACRVGKESGAAIKKTVIESRTRSIKIY